MMTKLKLVLKSISSRLRVYVALLGFALRGRNSAIKVVMFPSGSRGDPASHFRVYQLAKSLNKLDVYAFVVPDNMTLNERKVLIFFINPDVLFFQQCRHPLNDISFYPDRNVVLDSDDADILDDRIRDKIIRVAVNSSCVVVGSHYLEALFKVHADNVVVIWTGVSIPSFPSRLKVKNSIVWAQSSPGAYRSEFKFICSVLKKTAQGLRDAGSSEVLTFIIFNVPRDLQEEYLFPLKEAGVKCQLYGYLPVDKFNDVLSSAEIGLHYLDEEGNQYAKGKGFGKVLSYMINGVCIVSNKTNENKYFMVDSVNGIFAQDESEWVKAITYLVGSEVERKRMAGRAFSDCKEKLDVDLMAKSYRDIFYKVKSSG